MQKIIPILVALLLGMGGPAFGDDPKKIDPSEIIRRFTEKESEFSKVWQQYIYRQTIIFEVLDDFDKVRESRRVEMEVYFTTDGKREMRIVSDRGALHSVGVTEEDMTDALHRQPFVLTAEELPHYEIKYKGQEWADEIYTYMFDVKPRRIERGKRYFKGRLWVDDLDFQIVKTKGQIVPEFANNRFPEFETIRQQVDGRYWFPVWTHADDYLVFGGLFDSRRVHIRQWITYRDFQRFETETSIEYGPVEEPE